MKLSASLLIGIVLISPLVPYLLDRKSEWALWQFWAFAAVGAIPGYLIVRAFLRLEHWRKSRPTTRRR